MKLDYNSHMFRDLTGSNYYRYYQGERQMMEEIRRRNPQCCFEGCASGGLRTDIFNAQVNYNGHFVSDTVHPLECLRIRQNFALRMLPSYAGAWMVVHETPMGIGTYFNHNRLTRTKVLSAGDPWWDHTVDVTADFAAKVNLLGQWGISGDISSLRDGSVQTFMEAGRFYEAHQDFLGRSVCHLLTHLQEQNDVTGWTAVQYENVDGKGSLLFAFRLIDDSEELILFPKNLDEETQYCRPVVDRYCFQNYMMEATDRYARAQRMGIPSMSLFYPYTPALTYFSWALAHTWGQMYTGTVHDVDITQIERPYREFEQVHQAFMGASQKCADLAVYQSVLTRECRPYGAAFPTMSFIMASNFSGLMTDMVYEEDSVETLLSYPKIVVNCAEMLSDEHIARLRTYAERGGKLLLIGPCGAYTQSVEKRAPQQVAEAFGISAQIIPCEEKKTGVFAYEGNCVAFDDMRTTCCFSVPDGVLKSGDTVLGIREQVGRGEIMWLLPQLDGAPLDHVPFDRTPCIEFCDYDKPHPEVPPSVIPKLRATTGAMLRAIVGKPNITANCQSSDLLVSAFRVKPGYVVHIANISHTFSTEYRRVWHEDPLLGFDGGYRIPDPIEISLAYEGGSLPTITLFSTELEEGVVLEGKLADGRLLLTVPANLFGGYAMIEIA